MIPSLITRHNRGEKGLGAVQLRVHNIPEGHHLDQPGRAVGDAKSVYAGGGRERRSVGGDHFRPR